MFRLALPAVALAVALLPAGAADTKPIEPFNGKNFDGWKMRNEKNNLWKLGDPGVADPDSKELLLKKALEDTPKSMVNLLPVGGHGTDIYTAEKFGDCHVEVEFMIPKGSNSGVYLMGEYEVQILDSFGKPNDKLGPGDMGGIYNNAAPKVNASKKPGEWQKFVIDFQTPRFEGDKKVANAKFIKVTLNDQVIHENVEAKGSTGGGLTGKEAATGPLMFQGDHGPVAFRNIKITPKK